MAKAKIITPNAGIVGHVSSTYRKAMEFISVVSGSKVDEPTFTKRLAICQGCPARKEHEGKSYCGACGCGKWRMAELNNKLWWARLECPNGLFDAVEKTPPGSRDAPR